MFRRIRAIQAEQRAEERKNNPDVTIDRDPMPGFNDETDEVELQITELQARPPTKRLEDFDILEEQLKLYSNPVILPNGELSIEFRDTPREEEETKNAPILNLQMQAYPQGVGTAQK